MAKLKAMTQEARARLGWVSRLTQRAKIKVAASLTAGLKTVRGDCDWGDCSWNDCGWNGEWEKSACEELAREGLARRE